MATIKDVAKKANVSISTASYALNNKPNVAKETKERVLKAARELGYRPNIIARRLKTNKTGNVGVFIYGFGGPIFSDLLESIHIELLKEDLNLIVSTGKSSTKMLQEKLIDAAIIFDAFMEDDDIIRFAKERPVITLDRKLVGKNSYSSRVKNEELVYGFIKEITKKGFKKYAYLSGPKDNLDNIDRYRGYQKALLEVGIENISKFEGDYTVEKGYLIGEEIAKLKEKPEFIFCANDEMAVGLIRALKNNKIYVPHDISVAGFDGIELGLYINPQLSTIKIDYKGWGKKIAKNIIDLLKKTTKVTITNPEGYFNYKGTIK